MIESLPVPPDLPCSGLPVLAAPSAYPSAVSSKPVINEPAAADDHAPGGGRSREPAGRQQLLQLLVWPVVLPTCEAAPGNPRGHVKQKGGARLRPSRLQDSRRLSVGHFLRGLRNAPRLLRPLIRRLRRSIRPTGLKTPLCDLLAPSPHRKIPEHKCMGIYLPRQWITGDGHSDNGQTDLVPARRPISSASAISSITGVTRCSRPSCRLTDWAPASR